jgi:hypothetical protein
MMPEAHANQTEKNIQGKSTRRTSNRHYYRVHDGEERRGEERDLQGGVRLAALA